MALSNINTGATLHGLLQNRWLIWLVNALLVLWLVWLIGTAIRGYLEPPAEHVATLPTVATPVASRQQIPANQVAGWHLFGIPSDEDAKAPSVVINAPETKLKLTLRGIIAETDKHKGFAIIQKPDKKEQHFAVSDSIFGLATLEEIHVDRVIILRKDKYETLTLPKEMLVLEILADRIKKEAEKRSMSKWRQTFLDRKGMELIKMFGFDTFNRNGTFAGFKIKSLGEEGDRMLETLGLENGDLIMAVNGKRFATDLQATISLKELKTATKVDIEIERGGVPLFFHLEFDEEAPVDEPDTEAPETEAADKVMNGQPEEETNAPEPE